MSDDGTKVVLMCVYAQNVQCRQNVKLKCGSFVFENKRCVNFQHQSLVLSLITAAVS